jgi:hypothetical protein
MQSMTVPAANFDRLNYFFGQVLGVRHFRAEQDYVREKLKLHNRCLHGYGIVCGLDLSPPAALNNVVPVDTVHVGLGLALDANGDELVLRNDVDVNLFNLLSPADQATVTGTASTLYLSLCYHETPLEPMRPVVPDACGVPAGCAFGMIREDACLKVSLAPPVADTRASTCCQPPLDDGTSVLLGVINGYKKGTTLAAADLDGSARRPVAAATLTSVSGINWYHGGSVSAANADAALKDPNGLTITFSQPVSSETLVQGVIDLYRVAFADGAITRIPGDVVTPPPASPPVTSARFIKAAGSPNNFTPSDRVLVVVRSAFILDANCRPVDGVNSGGRVPTSNPLAFFSAPATKPTGCLTQPLRDAPWLSGSGSPGGNFESWFFIA